MLDLTQKIIDKNGNPVVQQIPTEKKGKGKKLKSLSITLKDILVESLLSLNASKKCNVKCKLKRYDLYTRIKDAKKINLTKKEIKLLNNVVSEKYDIYLTGQTVSMLNNK